MTLLPALACQPFDYTYADLEVVVAGELPADAELVRVCVEGVGVHEEGAGNGRIAVPGLPSDEAMVRVEVDDVDGTELLQADAVLAEAAGWASVPADAPDGEACVAEGEFAADDEAAFLLAISWAEGGCCSW